MTMKDYYKLSIGTGIDLCKKVKAEGTKVGTIWNSRSYRNNDLIEYQGDKFQIDSVHGIVDINDTAKEV